MQLLISNILRSIINISRIKIDYNIFFTNFFNKFILINKIKRAKFLNLKYKKKDLGFEDKSLKKKYYYSLDKQKNKKIIQKNNYLQYNFLVNV